jgi:hypothetical protein
MKKAIFLIFIFAVCALGEKLHDDGVYIQTVVGFTDNKDKIIGQTQSVKALIGERKNINEFHLGFYARGDTTGAKLYSSLWFGDQYGVGYGMEGRYKPSASIPVALILGFDRKFGIGSDAFEERNVTLPAINGGAATTIHFTDDTKFESTSLKLGVEFDISKHFTLNVAYVPKWDYYTIEYKEAGASIFRKEKTSWHEFHNSIQAGIVFYF